MVSCFQGFGGLFGYFLFLEPFFNCNSGGPVAFFLKDFFSYGVYLGGGESK